MSGVTVDELRSFHKIDRDLYKRLVKNLCHDAIDCLQVIALWLWLEQIGYPNIILKMLTLPDAIVNLVVEEATACLNLLDKNLHLSTLADNNNNNNNMPVTELLMVQSISLQFIYENKVEAIKGITQIVNKVCLRAFDDIAQEALAAKAAAEEELAAVAAQGNVHGGTNNEGAPHTAPLFGLGLFRPMFQVPVIAVPHQPAALLYGNPQQHPMEQSTEAAPAMTGSGSPLNPGAEPWSPNTDEEEEEEVPQDDRTMFVTFSRGYPMTEREVKEFFTKNYRGCKIEAMYMQEVPANTQPLYARMVFYEASSIAEILAGKEKAKFVINGKHVWVRQYVANQGRAPSGPAAEAAGAGAGAGAAN